MKDMPDPYVARESVWIPFTREVLGCDENTILVGHSSGAQCAMRYMEQYKIAGAFLISPCVTDMGIENEKASGYYNRPWLWDKMKENSQFIVQFSSRDDPLVPWEEQEQVHKNLKTELHMYQNEGHFLHDTFPDLTKAILKKIKELEKQ
jgi:predicted alpha/beta hydrolase family esterase